MVGALVNREKTRRGAPSHHVFSIATGQWGVNMKEVGSSMILLDWNEAREPCDLIYGVKRYFLGRYALCFRQRSYDLNHLSMIHCYKACARHLSLHVASHSL